MKTSDPAYEINAHSADRLGFGFFFAAAVHACLIFGMAIGSEEPESSIADLEITLVTHYSEEAPEDADFWAQQNQEASGTEEEALMLTSEMTDATPGENNAEGAEMLQSRLAAETPGAQVVTTVADSIDEVRADLDAEEEEVASQVEEEIARREAIAARLDVLQQDYAKRPRIGTLTSVSAKAREDAAYQLHLQDRIISNGNANYPTASLEQEVFGSLRLMLTILQDGTLESMEILESSGELVLDQAALEIARASAPFQSFPADTAERYDKIVFIRTWQFMPGGRLQTDE